MNPEGRAQLYWSRQPNFGDAFNRVLFTEIGGIPLLWRHQDKAKFFAVGSVAERIPEGFSGVVFGTGLMYIDSRIDLSHATVLALRGPLTEQRSGVKAQMLADPGLLAGTLATPTDLVKGRAVIPHFMDDKLADRYSGDVIDIEAGVKVVINEVAKYQQVVTSCLHGLILADSLGIPARWELSDAVEGNGFKFIDYEMSIGVEPRPGVWRQADGAKIAELQRGLLEKLEEIREHIG